MIYNLGHITRVTFDCAEVSKTAAPHPDEIENLIGIRVFEYNQSLETYNTSQKALKYIRVNEAVYVNDPIFGKIYGVIVEDLPDTFIVKFDERYPKAEQSVYIDV